MEQDSGTLESRGVQLLPALPGEEQPVAFEAQTEEPVWGEAGIACQGLVALAFHLYFACIYK